MGDATLAERLSANKVIAKLRRPRGALAAVLCLITAAMLIYSQTIAFVWDEGFHLVAAQLINWGEKPYIDFAFPQTLLNAYFNAGVLRFVGYSWRIVHVFDALFVSATVWLTATYVMRRFPEPRWKLPCAIVAACLIALNGVVVAFGPSSQAYGSGMLLAFAAFLVAVSAAERASLWRTVCAGLLAGAAAGSTLLAAPVVPVLLFWVFSQTHAKARLAKCGAFCLGAVIPFAPELILLAKAPRQTIFNVVEYQALFRGVNWGDVNAHDFDVFTDWTVSAEALLLGLFALIGILFIAKKSNWEKSLRNEFYLAGSIALALGAYISTAHPTFGRYFVFMIPFAAVVASAGFYYVGSRLTDDGNPRWPTLLVVFVLLVSIAKSVFDDRDFTLWKSYGEMAKKIKQVTPPGKEYMADEMVYFLLRERPPSGLEFSYSHKIQLSPKEEALYHIISLKGLKEQIEKGRFATVESCKDEITDYFEVDKYFPNKQDFDDCAVYWRAGKSSK